MACWTDSHSVDQTVRVGETADLFCESSSPYKASKTAKVVYQKLAPPIMAVDCGTISSPRIYCFGMIFCPNPAVFSGFTSQ